MVLPRAVSFAASGGGGTRNIIEKRGFFLKTDKKYRKDFPHRLYVFFTSYTDAGAPSFSKFARSIGVTLEDVEAFREHKEFDRAYRECTEIRRDYLIDNALLKRFDSSFTKFLLTEERENGQKDGDGGEIKLTLRVLDDGA